MSRALLLAAFFAGSVCAPFYSHAQEANMPPVITLLSLETNNPNPLYAQAGNSIVVVVETNEDISVPLVSINGAAVVMTEVTTTRFEGSHMVSSDEPAGEVVLSVTVADLLGSNTVATDVTAGELVIIGLGDSLIPDFTFEATDSAGSVFVYSVPAVSASTVCTPISGSLFNVGATEVTCVVEDSEGGEPTIIATFMVTVTDTTAPVVTLVGDALISLSEGDTYTELGATATDNGDPAVVVVTGDAPNINSAGTYAVTYTATDASGNSASTVRVVQVAARSGGGGGGGGSRRSTSSSSGDGEVLGVSDERPVESSVEPEGEVLGATTYNFTRLLRQGDTGEEVTELQNLLARGGYFTEAPTGYFGPVTAAALRSYQTANSLEAVGFVGPKTLMLLNAGSVTKEMRIQTLMEEIARIQEEIARLKNI